MSPPRVIGSFVLVLGLAIAPLLNGACSDSTESPVDAGADAEEAGPTDPFCKGRPLLPFCEDFDEKPLPGAFAELSADPSIDVTIADDESAPSAPKIVTFTKRDGAAGSSFLRTPRAPRGPKANGFFRVRVDAIGTEIEIAAFDQDDGHRLALVITSDGSVGLRESPVSTADGGAPDGKHSSTVKIEAKTWTSIRWDIRFIDNVARTRLRVGSATAFDGEPFGLTGIDAATRFSIGSGVASTSAVSASFDSITFASDVE